MIFNSLIFDKSTFQSLSLDEMFFLRTYYFPTITHILIVEILADLKKGGTNAITYERVSDFSNKILQLNPTYSAPYYDLLEMNLLGYKVEMLGRPNVAGGKNVTDEDGKAGVVFKQAPEEQILQRWRDSKFEEAEELMADSWRNSIDYTKIDLSRVERPDFLKGMKKLSDLTTYIDNYFKIPGAQKEILTNILSTFSIHPQTSSEIFHRFENEKAQLISEFAPYALFCYRAFLTFRLSLYRGFTTPRLTDILDLQYLYYLPFTTIFSSIDKFHKMFAPPLLRLDQHYISGIDLKSDLRIFVEMKEGLPSDEKDTWIEKHKHFPPENVDSFTWKIWDSGANKSYKDWVGTEKVVDPAADQKIVEEVKRRASGLPASDQSTSFDDEKTDFIVKETWIRPNDFCPCGSGKSFKDCHLPEVKKNT